MKIIKFKNIADLRERISEIGLEQFVVIHLDDKEFFLDSNYMSRMEELVSDSDATIAFCHYREKDGDKITLHPIIDYQFGSVRDDFDFGSLIVINAADAIAAVDDLDPEENNTLDGGWYALRLKMSIGKTVAAVPEYLYTVEKTDNRKSGDRQHDYVKPSNILRQSQMERVFTEFLCEVRGLVSFNPITVNLEEDTFENEASVIIPVKNRVSTIGDAVRSALSQKTSFPFNVIVVDNASTDGTSEMLSEIDDPRLKVINVKESEFLGIGGCWNRAIYSSFCGRFAIQLDSDDLYIDEKVIQTIVEKFRSDKCAMVVGSYNMVDFDCKPIPPYLIDHKEWTDFNGANNALRINGFGAPRAFFTPVIRSVGFPNVSYGEDYAVALRISREYKIGRIFESLYLCRRWSGNSDADLSVEKTNEHNEYKDFIRSVELISRIRMNIHNEI